MKNRPSPTPSQKAAKTARWATTMTKWRISFMTGGSVVGSRTVSPSRQWQLVAFPGRKGGESRGIVDLLAIRKDHHTATKTFHRGDLFEIILIQIKGGTAPLPTGMDLRRLRAVRRHYGARDVLLASWRRGRQPTFFSLAPGASRSGRRAWVEVDPGKVFK